ncbi:MAG TPA: hypothetical protein VFN71_01970 [Methylomirabilota bacterium]|nr:hypothetical protein [Methylomirabilota bacterium]
MRRSTAALFAIMGLAIAGVLAADLVGSGFWRSSAPEPPELRPQKRAVYLVPIGPPTPPFIEDLVQHYRDKYGIWIVVLPEVPLEPAVVDNRRGQVIAEEAIELIKRANPDQAADTGAVLIGLMTHDIYIRGFTRWRWAFALREDGRFAVVSTARMDPRFWGGRPDDALFQTRLRKMVTKNIGAMYFGLEPSRKRRSVMFGPILGLDDLDRIGEEF